MSGDVVWSKGFHNEYQLFEQALNRNGADLAGLLSSIRTDGVGVMQAYGGIFGRPFVDNLTDVADCWFGTQGAAQWLWDSTLSTGQMHQVMRETTARIAALLLAGVRPVELWLQCGHPRYRTVLAWEGATAEDAQPPVGGVWTPKQPRGRLRVWVYVPFNAGYGTVAQPTKAAQDARDALAARVPSSGDGPHPEHLSPPMSLRDVHDIVYGYPGGHLVWRRTNLALQASADPWPDPAGMSYSYVGEFAEPPPTMPYDAPRQRPVWARRSPAIEISWQGAGPGHLIYHASDLARPAAPPVAGPAGPTSAGPTTPGSV